MDMLSDELTTLALCWRVERRDGVTIGLTGHDRDLLIDGLLHRAAPGMAPSAIRRGLGLEADTMDVAGALASAAIGEADLLAGRWDGARVTLFAVDWTGGPQDFPDRVELGEGRIGAVSVKGGAFTAELQGASASLARPVVEETSPECRAELGDRRCRVAMAGRRVFARVVACTQRVMTVDAVLAPGAYAGGRLRWFGGANGGLEGWIAASSGMTLTLRAEPAFAVEVGTLVELIEGCDKSLATCAGRFGNAANFRGEPYLPGLDLLTRYPGA
ncbi:DUF2163 domain-containing protein [Sphingomonas sp.]|jgi:uncharacterized phage protein (TIGR02218 family)|uniref:DUF2163 domain-containing protein n=1 Tax=Sphingomonas sp. TaxID=28214 RepID=UPI002D7F8991|nr:DUF2163 domain-containing protein [Sphingomonas sp.]HEU0043857.1 DUF2163 domain-containing protein [Sphingomonas sp.]